MFAVVWGGGVAEEGSSCVVRITLPEETQPLVQGCENSPGVDMLDILRPPKGGHLGDIGGHIPINPKAPGGALEECEKAE